MSTGDDRHTLSYTQSFTSYDVNDLNGLWERLEAPVLGLTCNIKIKYFETGTKKEIKLIKNSIFTDEDVTEMIKCLGQKNVSTHKNARKVTSGITSNEWLFCLSQVASLCSLKNDSQIYVCDYHVNGNVVC